MAADANPCEHSAGVACSWLQSSLLKNGINYAREGEKQPLALLWRGNQVHPGTQGVLTVKAIILVGGEGTRLRPLTIHRPKPMQPVVNRPFIEHVFRHLKAHGVTDIILSMCYLPGKIQEYFGDGSAFGVHLTYVTEEQALGTAGAVKNVEAQGHLKANEPLFVLNGDILTDLDLRAMLAFHRERGALGTIALTPVEYVRAYGL